MRRILWLVEPKGAHRQLFNANVHGGFRMTQFGRRIFISLMVVSAFALVLLGSGTSATFAAQKVYRLKIQSLFPRGDLSMELLKVFVDSAEKRSNGQLKITVFAEPELVPGDQLFGATKQGMVDMLHGMGGMWSGFVPVGNIEFNLPLAYRIDEKETFEDKAQAVREFVMDKGFSDLLRQEYAKHGLYFLDIHTYGPVPFVLSTKPLNTCQDLKGKKIKADGINRTFHAKVGMHGAEISPTEAYMALRLGTVEVAEWDVSAVTGLNWHEVAPYWIRGMECDHTTGHILVNMRKWNQLPDDLKAVLREAAKDYWHATVAGYKQEMQAVQELVAKGTLKEIMLDESCRAEYAKGAYEIWDELAAVDPASAKAIEMIRQWRKR
jgi:TRAP-type mannitol/chloroaromatic compound transport system substrate-binding protein